VITALSMVFSGVAFALSIWVLCVVQKNWLTIARTHRTLARTARARARMAARYSTREERRHLASAAEHDEEARKCERRAWPFRPADPTGVVQ
jgi:hypothetical protein